MVAPTHLVDACGRDELTTDRCHMVGIGDVTVGLLLYEGRPVAILNECPHMGGPLAQGRVNLARGEIICPWHFFRFSLATGESITNPALAASFLSTEVAGDRVMVDIGALAEMRA
jgi:nitrite reductase/ring-hydroxylating ferredoxin subunit